ncbi:hypothetical protein [Erythrobacter sp. JK5]|uniref:hypothetical protein n=1 Tax=Erythrobacter sp. JK5 TaxID=2829500 RepID=UPI001BA95ED0|nr:hypothetical protein [Erythrobacter sp. JK5]QUL38629.1 hypothetical protein KDC96_04365 [Erythrobacter sp. JK5]
MNGGTIALMIAGLVGFAGGAMIAATGSREVGIAMMVIGLVMQVLTLRQLKAAKKKESSDARG